MKTTRLLGGPPEAGGRRGPSIMVSPHARQTLAPQELVVWQPNAELAPALVTANQKSRASIMNPTRTCGDAPTEGPSVAETAASPRWGSGIPARLPTATAADTITRLALKPASSGLWTATDGLCPRGIAPYTVISPEQPCRDAAPRHPPLRQRSEFPLLWTLTHSKPLLHADLQGKVAGRKDVGMADAKEKIDLRGPRTDALQCRHRRDGLVGGKIVHGEEVEAVSCRGGDAAQRANLSA